MIRAAASMLLVSGVLAGCGAAPSDDVSSTSHNLAATKVYDADFRFTSPKACTVHVNQVITDVNDAVIEYDTTGPKSGKPISATYIVSGASKLPLRLVLSEGSPGNGKTLLTVLLSATEEQVLSASNAVLFDDEGYFASAADGGSAGQATSDAGAAQSSDAGASANATIDAEELEDAVALAQCSPDTQSAFGILPAILNRRQTVVSSAGNVTTTNADGPPLVVGWPNGEPFGSALFVASSCLAVHDGALAFVCPGGP